MAVSQFNQPTTPLPVDIFSTAAFADAPMVTEFEEQGHQFMQVWDVNAEGDLVYRVLRWQKGVLKSNTEPELFKHIIYSKTGQIQTIR